MIKILLMLAYLQLTNSGNVRLIKFGCADKNANFIPEWKDADQNIFLKELCSIQATIKGFQNNETLTTNEENSEHISNYQLLVLLSLTKSPDFKSILNLIKLETLSLSAQNISDNGICEISVDNVTLPAVEFCGEVYLVAVLQKNDGLQVSISGFLAMPLTIRCNEQFVDLALISKIPKIDTVVNFHSHQNYMKVINNFKVKNVFNKYYSLPNDIQLIVKNNGNQTLRQRCGIYFLPVLSFIIGYNDADWLPLGTNNKEFASLLNHSAKRLLKSSLDSLVLNSDNGLFNSKYGKCSPQIQPNGEIALNMSYFTFNETEAEKLAQFSLLVTIIDPFSAINELKRENNVFVLPLYFHGNKNKTYQQCIVHSNPQCFGREAIVIHNTNNITIKAYHYNSNDRLLTKLNPTEALNRTLRYHLQNWFINRRYEQLLSRNECPKHVNPRSLFDQFADLLSKISSSVARIPVKTEWQNSQLIRIKYLVEAMHGLLNGIKTGLLAMFRVDAINCFRNVLRINENNDTTSEAIFGEVLNSIKRVITTNENSLKPINSVNNKSDHIFPKRISKFLNRLANEHINATFHTIPQLIKNNKFAENMKNVLLWIRGDDLFNFNLPKTVNDLIIEAITFPQNNVTKLVENCIQLSDKYISLLKDDKTNRKESLILFKSLVRTLLVEGVWSSWHELHAEWNHLLTNTTRYIIMNGFIDDNYGDENFQCKERAMNDLVYWKVMPEWLTAANEVESVGLNSWNSVVFYADKGIIKRRDFDPITGWKYWLPIMMCECSSQQNDACV